MFENSVFVFRFSVAFWTEILAETESLNQTETETETHTETEISAETETETETENFRSLVWTLYSLAQSRRRQSRSSQRFKNADSL